MEVEVTVAEFIAIEGRELDEGKPDDVPLLNFTFLPLDTAVEEALHSDEQMHIHLSNKKIYITNFIQKTEYCLPPSAPPPPPIFFDALEGNGVVELPATGVPLLPAFVEPPVEFDAPGFGELAAPDDVPDFGELAAPDDVPGFCELAAPDDAPGIGELATPDCLGEDALDVAPEGDGVAPPGGGGINPPHFSQLGRSGNSAAPSVRQTYEQKINRITVRIFNCKILG